MNQYRSKINSFLPLFLPSKQPEFPSGVFTDSISLWSHTAAAYRCTKKWVSCVSFKTCNCFKPLILCIYFLQSSCSVSCRHSIILTKWSQLRMFFFSWRFVRRCFSVSEVRYCANSTLSTVLLKTEFPSRFVVGLFKALLNFIRSALRAEMLGEAHPHCR